MRPTSLMGRTSGDPVTRSGTPHAYGATMVTVSPACTDTLRLRRSCPSPGTSMTTSRVATAWSTTLDSPRPATRDRRRHRPDAQSAGDSRWPSGGQCRQDCDDLVVGLHQELGDAGDRTEVPVDLEGRSTGPSLERVQVEQRAGRQWAEERLDRALGEPPVTQPRGETQHPRLAPPGVAGALGKAKRERGP